MPKNVAGKNWSNRSAVRGRRYSEASSAIIPPTISQSSLTSSTITISITGGSGATIWTAQFKLTGDSTWTDAGTVSTSATSAVYSSLSASTSYNLRIKCQNEKYTDYSDVSTITTSASSSGNNNNNNNNNNNLTVNGWWFDYVNAYEWVEIAGGSSFSGSNFQKGNRLYDVKPSINPPDPEHWAGLINAWTGGAVYQAGKKLILPAQGGHNDYYGNEVYSLDVAANIPAWTRIKEPTPNSMLSSKNFYQGQMYSGYADGAPRSSHGWFSIICTNDGRIFNTLQNANPDGSWDFGAYSIDVNNPSAGWTYHGRMFTDNTPELFLFNNSDFNYQSGPIAYNPTTNKFYKAPKAGNYLIGGEYDVATIVAAGGRPIPKFNSTDPRIIEFSGIITTTTQLASISSPSIGDTYKEVKQYLGTNTIATSSVSITENSITPNGGRYEDAGVTIKYYSNGGTPIQTTSGPLVDGQTYYTGYVEGTNPNRIKLATSMADVYAGVFLDITGTGNDSQYFSREIVNNYWVYTGTTGGDSISGFRSVAPQVAGSTIYSGSKSIGTWSVILDDTDPPCWIVGNTHGTYDVNYPGSRCLNVMNLNNPSAGWTTVNAISPSNLWPTGITEAHNAFYHKQTNSIIIAGATDNTASQTSAMTLYRLKLSSNNPLTATYTWTEIPISGLTPQSINGWNGSWSKMQMINDMGNGQSALVVATKADGPAYVMKIPNDLSPKWYSDMPENTWGVIASAATIDAVKPATHPGGVYQTNGPMVAGGGATVDTTRQELQIGAQGGHNDYHGNEVYALKLNQNVPAWQRVSNPSSFADNPPSHGHYMSDGSPRSAHTAGQISYDPNTDRYILTSVVFDAPYGDSSRQLFAFNRNTSTWTELASLPSNYGTDGGDSYGVSCYDSTTGCIWIVQTSSWDGVSKYNPVTNTHTVYSTGLLNHSYNCSGALSASKRCMIVLNGQAVSDDGTFRWLDLDNPTAGWRLPAAVTGTPVTGRASSIVWHETSGAFIAWKGTGAELALLIPPANLVTGTWKWVDITISSANTVTPTAGQANGTYGRFNIITNLNGSGRDCLVLINSTTQSTYVYKIPPSGFTDWHIRSKKTGVFYANNFEQYQNRDQLQVDHFSYPSLGSNNQKHGTSGRYKLELDNSGLSGKSVRMNLFAAEGANESPGWYTFSFGPIGSKVKSAVTKMKFYIQFSVYMDSTYGTFEYINGSKLMIIAEPDRSYTNTLTNEVVLFRSNAGQKNTPGVYRMSSGPYGRAAGTVAAGMGWIDSNGASLYNYTNHIFVNNDTSNTTRPSNSTQLQNRFGQTTYDWTYNPNYHPRYELDGWTTVEMYIDKEWSAADGGDPGYAKLKTTEHTTEWWSGTAVGGSTTTLIVSNAAWSANYYNQGADLDSGDFYVYAYAGAGSGQVQKILSNTGGISGRISCSTTSTTVTGNQYTKFLTEISAGATLYKYDGVVVGTVASIQSDSSLTLTSNASIDLDDKDARTTQYLTLTLVSAVATAFNNTTQFRIVSYNKGMIKIWIAPHGSAPVLSLGTTNAQLGSVPYNGLQFGPRTENAFDSTRLTGTLITSLTSTTVTGIDTLFTTELYVGARILNESDTLIGIVASIQNNTSLTLDSNAQVEITNNSTYKTYRIVKWPLVDTYAKYSDFILSDNPIEFPGGYSLPYPGTELPANFPWNGSYQGS